MVYTSSELKSFVEGMIKVDRILKELSPDHIIAPLMSAIPFIDVLAIINPNLDLNSVEYSPETSKFENLGDLISDWYSHFISQKFLEDEELNLVSINEVVSGTSAVRSYSFFSKVLERIAKEQVAELRDQDPSTKDKMFMEEYKRRITDLKSRIIHKTIGIEDSKGVKQRDSNKPYNRLKRENHVIPVSVEKIIPMDNPMYSPAQLEFSHRNGHERPFYFPKIASFNMTPEYLEFLQDIARYIGADPQKVGPVNQSKILDFPRYLSDRLKK